MTPRSLVSATNVRCESRLAAHGLQHNPQATCPGEGDDRLVAQDAQAHSPARRQPVLGVDRQHGRLASHHDRAQAGRWILARSETEERRLQVAGRQPVQ